MKNKNKMGIVTFSKEVIKIFNPIVFQYLMIFWLWFWVLDIKIEYPKVI